MVVAARRPAYEPTNPAGERGIAAFRAGPDVFLQTTGLLEPVRKLGLPTSFANLIVGAFVYDSADTRASLEDLCAAAAVQLTRPIWQRDAPPAPNEIVGSGAIFTNPIGRGDLVPLTKILYSMGDREALLIAAHAVLTTRTATRLFRETHGRPPRQAAELVPDWLPRSFDDAFRAEGIQIAEGQVRSVGTDEYWSSLLSMPIEYTGPPRSGP